MARSHFDINTKGSCLFCLNASSDNLSDCEYSSGKTAFKMLIRYLKVDLGKVARVSMSASTSSNPGMLFDSDSVDLSVSLCSECSSVTDEFLEVFQNFEKVRIELEECVQVVLHFIRKGNLPERVRDYEMRVNDKQPPDLIQACIAETLRNEALEKCALKVGASIPRIVLDKNSAEDPSIPIGGQPSSPGSHHRRYSIGIDETIIIKREKESPDRDDGRHLETESDEEYVPSPKKYNRRVRKKSNVKTEEECCGEEATPEMTTAELRLVQRQRQSTRPPKRIRIRNPGKCVYCGELFSSEYNAQNHQYHVHTMALLSGKIGAEVTEESVNTSVEKIVCRTKVFMNEKTRRATFQCLWCPKGLEGKSKLRVHLLKCHIDKVIESPLAEGKGVIEDERGTSCEGQAASILSMERTPCKCVHCGKDYNHQKSLDRHLLRAHTLATFADRIPAGISEQKFKGALKAMVNSQEATCSNEEGAIAMICEFCEIGFRTGHQLKLHLLRSHLAKVVEQAKTFKGVDKRKLRIRSKRRH